MKFFVDVQWCNYSKPLFFGLFRGMRAARVPFEIAIISESGMGFFHAINGSLKPSGILDACCRERYRSAIFLRRKFSVIHAGLREFVKENSDDRTLEMFSLDWMGLFPSEFMLETEGRIVVAQVEERLNWLAREMNNEDFAIDTDFLLYLYSNTPYNQDQKIQIIKSHPDWPKTEPITCIDRVLQARIEIEIIDKIKLKINVGK